MGNIMKQTNEEIMEKIVERARELLLTNEYLFDLALEMAYEEAENK
jgi:hypothetical protein